MALVQWEELAYNYSLDDECLELGTVEDRSELGWGLKRDVKERRCCWPPAAERWASRNLPCVSWAEGRLQQA